MTTGRPQIRLSNVGKFIIKANIENRKCRRTNLDSDRNLYKKMCLEVNDIYRNIIP